MKDTLNRALKLNEEQVALDSEITHHVQENFKSVLKVVVRGNLIIVDLLGGYSFNFGCDSDVVRVTYLGNCNTAKYIQQSEIEAELIFADIKKYCEE